MPELGKRRVSDADVSAVCDFLLCPTPQAWLDQAPDHLAELLIDHANCEKKAAGNAMSLLYRYVDRPELLDKLSRLAREELLHFEQVVVHMRSHNVDYVHISPSSYAGGLRKGLIATHEPLRLVDTLIVGAVVEARSCERFYRLSQRFGGQHEEEQGEPCKLAELGVFYARLLASEARHFHDYLQLAQRYSSEPIEDRVQRVLTREAELVQERAAEFRFHSGPLG